jgi:uncharacterized protein (TIGR03086 family)
MDMLDQLDLAFAHTGAIIDGVDDKQWTGASPCERWDARAVVNHIVAVNTMFVNAFAAEDPPDFGADHVGNDPRRAYTDGVETTRSAWREPGSMARTLKMPFGEIPGEMAARLNFLEVFVHGCDLAVATEQESRIDEAVAESTLAMAKQAGVDNFRAPGVMGPAVACADDAPAHQRLLCYFGRVL